MYQLKKNKGDETTEKLSSSSRRMEAELNTDGATV